MRHEMITLQRKHAALEEKLRKLMKGPDINSLEITRVKMEKLRIKDKLEAMTRMENAKNWDRESSVRGRASSQNANKRADGKRAGGGKFLREQGDDRTDEEALSVKAILAAATASGVSIFGTAMLMGSV